MEMKFNKIIRDYLKESNPNLIKAKTLRAEAEALEKGSEENEEGFVDHNTWKFVPYPKKSQQDIQAAKEKTRSVTDWRFIPFQGKSPQDIQPAEKPVKPIKPVKPMTDEEKRIFLDILKRIELTDKGFNKTPQKKDRLIKPAEGFNKTPQKKDRLIKPV